MLDLPHRLDGRTTAAKALAARVAELTAPGGAAVRQALARRAAALEMAVEGTEARLARGEPVDLGQHAAAVGELRRVLAMLGGADHV